MYGDCVSPPQSSFPCSCLTFPGTIVLSKGPIRLIFHRQPKCFGAGCWGWYPCSSWSFEDVPEGSTRAAFYRWMLSQVCWSQLWVSPFLIYGLYHQQILGWYPSLRNKVHETRQNFYWSRFWCVTGIKEPEEKKKAMMEIFETLPTPNRLTSVYLLVHLRRYAQFD